jgi:L-tyrosine isonitrile synthase
MKAARAGSVASDAVLRTFNTWAFKREQPSDPALMLRFVTYAMAVGEPISFVLYWGKGPRSRLGPPDLECLDFLTSLARRVRTVYEHGAAVRLILTDTHATLNGHSGASMSTYFADVEADARQRGFDTCRLSELTRAVADVAFADEPVPGETLRRLCDSAKKWYRGTGSIEDGAREYYRMNMVERRAVELAFPHSIFVTFNGSELRDLFPRSLPIFFMYSLRRGISTKPWFLPAEAVEGVGRA